jgi:hypothetical protein
MLGPASTETTLGVMRRRAGDTWCCAVIEGTAIMLLDEGERRPASSTAEPITLTDVPGSAEAAPDVPSTTASALPDGTTGAAAGWAALIEGAATTPAVATVAPGAETSSGATRRFTGSTVIPPAAATASVPPPAADPAMGAPGCPVLPNVLVVPRPAFSDSTKGLERRSTAGVSLWSSRGRGKSGGVWDREKHGGRLQLRTGQWGAVAPRAPPGRTTPQRRSRPWSRRRAGRRRWTTRRLLSCRSESR